MLSRTKHILLVIALSLFTALPAVISAADQQNIDAFCPPGVARVSLETAQQLGEDSKIGGDAQFRAEVHQPAFFATPLQFNDPLSTALSGTWTEDGKKWQLCLVAPSTSPSLILIFDNTLRLPLGSSLEVESNGGSKETFSTQHDDISLFFSRKKATNPMAGNAVLLTYTRGRKLGFSTNQDPRQQQDSQPLKWQQKQPNIEIKAVLQSKLYFKNSKPASIAAKAAFARSLLAENANTTTSTDAASLTNSKEFLNGTVELSTEQIGASTPCFKNAACVPFLDNARRSTVMLMLVSEFGGRFCTGSFINGPVATESSTQVDEPYILTANHCRETDDDVTIASSWGVILNNEEPCSSSSSASAAAVRRMLLSQGESPVVSAKQVIQGLEVVFSDEQSDVMLLKLKNPIPEEYTPYLLGWDASGTTLAPSGSGAVHHPLGDLKKAATSTQRLHKEKWKFSERTHLKVEWADGGGGTLDGSSGAALVNKETSQALGVLSGGITAKTCSGNHDFFGSLEHAWDRGLKEILNPQAKQVQGIRAIFGSAAAAASAAGQSMTGREYTLPATSSNTLNGPQLIIDPPRLIFPESSKEENVAQVSLTEAPENGDGVQVQLTLTQFPNPPHGSSAKNPSSVDFPTQPPITLVTETLLFTPTNWNTTQPVILIPGDDALAEGPLPFQIELKSAIMKTGESTDNSTSSVFTTVLEQRVVQGLRTDEELVPGYSIDDPVVIVADPLVGINVQGQGILEPQGGRTPNKAKLIHLKDPLQQHVDNMPLGSTTYYSLSLSKEGVFDVQACSQEMELQVAVYFNTTATWVTSEPCASTVSRTCKSTQVQGTGCSGFKHLALPSIRFPYIIAVTSTGNGSSAGFYTFVMKKNENAVI